MLLGFGALCVAVLGVYIGSQAWVQQKIEQMPPPSSRMGSGAMFDDLAGSYDLLNKLISLGLDQWWREQSIAGLEIQRGWNVLDVATGTADVALMVQSKHPGVTVAGIDPSAEMLAVGRTKARQMSAAVDLKQGVAESLPFQDGEFNSVTVSFGVRNFENRTKGLQEMRRVLKSDDSSRLTILEVGNTDSDTSAPFVVRKLSGFFVQQIVPLLGGIVSGHPDKYRYLEQSMAAFPDTLTFSKMLENAGLSLYEHRRLPPFGQGPHLYICKPGKQATT